MYCEKCGAPMAPGEKFCSKCGVPAGTPKVNLKKEAEPQQVTDFDGYCDGCGAKLPPAARNCPQCGRQTPLGDRLNGPAVAHAPSGAPAPPKRPKWVIPTIAASAAGIVLAVVFGTQALSGGWFSSGKNMVVTEGKATASASAPAASASASSLFSTKPASTPTPLANVASSSTVSERATSASGAQTVQNIGTAVGPVAGVNFTLTDEQSRALIYEVGVPLMFADGCTDSATATHTVNLAQEDADFWKSSTYPLAYDSPVETRQALQGRPKANEIQPDVRIDPYTLDPGGNYYVPAGAILNFSVIPAETLRDYMQDAFGTDSMLTEGDVLTGNGEYRLVMLGDPEVYVSVAGCLPLTAADGEIQLQSTLGYDGYESDSVFNLTLYVTEAPEGRYGCHVLGYTLDYLGTDATVSVMTMPPASAVPERTAVASSKPDVPAAPRGFDANGFVFADSSERYLTPEELQGLSKEMLAFARNEIFARNGNLFRKDQYINHYTQYAWYNNMPGKRHDIMPEDLTEIERANIRLIQSFE